MQNHESQIVALMPNQPPHSQTNIASFPQDPEPWPDPVDGKSLLDSLAVLLTRHVILPPHAADTLALWVLHTYAFESRDVATYLGVESPRKALRQNYPPEHSRPTRPPSRRRRQHQRSRLLPRHRRIPAHPPH